MRGASGALVVAAIMATAAPAAAERVCVEEAAGVCLKYRTVAPTAPAAPSMSADEAALSTDDRRAVQRKLQALGHYRGGIDAQFGPGTRRAISSWQRSEGFSASGRLNRGQINALLAAPATGGGASTAAASAPPSGDWDEARAQMLAGSRCEIRTREGYFVKSTLRAGGQLNAVTTEGDYTGTWEVEGDEFCMRIIGRKECFSVSPRPMGREAFYAEMANACISFDKP
ncbi:MAG: peptidoglycan-binding domain-containing protein [Pseudomonadota bacterium]